MVVCHLMYPTTGLREKCSRSVPLWCVICIQNKLGPVPRRILHPGVSNPWTAQEVEQISACCGCGDNSSAAAFDWCLSFRQYKSIDCLIDQCQVSPCLTRCHGCRFGQFLGITCLESFTASSMGLAVGSIAPTGM